jgi:hypothetical protein
VSARLGRTPSTLLGVSLLGYPDQLVEIEAIAVLDPDRETAGAPVLHVSAGAIKEWNDDVVERFGSFDARRVGGVG